MHEKKRANLALKLIRMLNDAREAAKDDARPRGPDYIRNGFDMSFVNREEFFALNDYVLTEEAYWRKFHPYYIREKLIDLIYGIAQGEPFTEESVRAAVDAFDTRLWDYSDTAEVYIPLTGIQMTLPKLEIGNITLVVMDESRLEALKQHVLASPMLLSIASEEREKHVEYEIEEFKDTLLNRVCVRIEVLGDIYKVMEVAEEESRKAIDLLRYALPFIHWWRPAMYVGMLGALADGSREVTKMTVWSSGWIGGGRERKGPAFDLKLDEEAFVAMVNARAFEMAEVIKLGSPTAFEQSLLTAIHWFANAQTELERQYQFLSMIICLETLFTPEAGEPITKTVAEGIALVAGTDLEMRKKWKKTMLELYRVRSAIAHKGKVEITQQELSYLHEIAKTVLRNLIARKGEFQSKDDLTRWIDEQKLSHIGATVQVSELVTPEAQREAFSRYVGVGYAGTVLASDLEVTQEASAQTGVEPDLAEPEVRVEVDRTSLGSEWEEQDQGKVLLEDEVAGEG